MANSGCLILLVYIVYVNIAASCDVYYVDQGTLIQTKNYPKDYPESFSQCWELYTSSAIDDTLYLRFLDFNTEYSYDVVNVYDGLSIRATLLVSLSGGMIRDDYSVQSNSQDMTVNFTSDVSITYEGFQACVCVQSSAPCSCSSGNLPISTIIAIAIVVPVMVLIVAVFLIRLVYLYSYSKSSQRRVHPTNNRRPQGQQIQSRGGQLVVHFRQQTRPPGQGIAPPSNGQLSGQQIASPGNVPHPGQPVRGTYPSGQYPSPVGRQITPSSEQLPQPMRLTDQPPPYQEPQRFNQPQPPPYTPLPLSSVGPGQPPVSTALPQQQTSSNAAVPPAKPPPAPGGLYMNSGHNEPPPVPKVT
ncbi:hypothetical protein LSH36_142g02006 [Paralvinella palmiformis]|uniref:CUB domain-containing protein n=1 Tax=Paralvinella palmiformis TaxID=53620 RepID=A0AAD9JV90_9ANNE|nr:hypothetical protein LSH36_142g02006 [Paralvinella palmiformis]